MSGRRSLVALAVGLALAGGTGATAHHRIPGRSGNNKAVELSNLGSDAVDLSCPIPAGLYANGKPISESPPTAWRWAPWPRQPGAGQSPPPKCRILAKANQTSGNLVFNGDDALVLYRGSEIIDSFGQVGWIGHVLGLRQRFDPGHDPAPQDTTVTTGRTDATVAFDPAQEYVAAPRMTPAVWVAVAMVPAMAPSRPPSSRPVDRWCRCPPFRPRQQQPLVPGRQVRIGTGLCHPRRG